MITDADIKKLEVVFATKADLLNLNDKIDTEFATKKELKSEIQSLESKMDSGFAEIISFIGEVKDEIMGEFREFRKEMNEFRTEANNTKTSTQYILDNHESRISRLEYIAK